MTTTGLLQIALFFVVIFAVTKPLGIYLYQVYSGGRTFIHPVLRPVEVAIYKIARIDEKKEMHWTVYTLAMLLFSLVTLLMTYLVLRLQDILPLNQAIDAQRHAHSAKCRKRWLLIPPPALPPTPTGKTMCRKPALMHHRQGSASAASGVTYFTPDDPTGLSQLCLGSNRVSLSLLRLSGDWPAARPRTRQFLGGHRPRCVCTCCCRSA